VGTRAVRRAGLVRPPAAVTAHLASAVGPTLSLGPSGASPDPELTARMMQALAEELARLSLEDPERYPVDRLVEYADWALPAFTRGG
jgi:hypothetical protein